MNLYIVGTCIHVRLFAHTIQNVHKKKILQIRPLGDPFTNCSMLSLMIRSFGTRLIIWILEKIKSRFDSDKLVSERSNEKQETDREED
jgi:hypothetical protein